MSVATRGKQTIFLRDHDSLDPFEWAGGGSGLRGIRAPKRGVTWRDPHDYAALLAPFASLEVITDGPAPVETSLRLKKEVRNALVEKWLSCRWDVDVRWQLCGRRDDRTNWEAITRLCQARFLSYETDGDEVVTQQSEDGEVFLTSPLRAPWPLVHFWRLTAKTISIPTSEDFTVVRVCEAEQCADATGQAKGCVLAIGTTGYYDSPGIYLSQDAGFTWSLKAISGWAGDVDGFSCLGNLIVAVSAMDHQVARSLDLGETWAFVSLSAAPLDVAFIHPACVVAVGEGGTIWRSVDGAVTFAVVAAGGEDLYRVVPVDDQVWWAVGDNNTVVRSEDGADTWASVSMPASQAGVDVTAILPLDDNRILVGYADGSLWLSGDGGENWQQDSSVTGFAEITSFTDCGCGRIVMVGFDLTNQGLMYESLDAGALGTWEAHTLPSGTGPLSSVTCCGPNFFVAVGSGVYPTGVAGKVVILS